MKNIDKSRKYDIFHAHNKVQEKVVSDNNFTYRILLNVINKHLKPQKNILDIGCGTGTISIHLAAMGNKVMGIDVSGNAISSARKSAITIGLREIKFERMNFPNEIPSSKFDLIICFEVLEHIEDDLFSLKQIYRLLTKNGIAIISTPSKNAPLHKLGLTDEFDKKVGHLRRYDINSLEKLCRDAGFTIIDERKTEGLLRNFLFINSVAGRIIRFLKSYLSDLVTFLDNIFLRVFGESQLIFTLKKKL